MLRPPTEQTQGDKSVFNFRLSHARRVVDCCSGTMVAQWRLYPRVLGATPEVTEKIVKATCPLHSFMRWEDGRSVPAPAEPLLGAKNTRQVGGSKATWEAIAVRGTYSRLLLMDRTGAMAELQHLENLNYRLSVLLKRQRRCSR